MVDAVTRITEGEGGFGDSLRLTIDNMSVYLNGYLMKPFEELYKRNGFVRFQFFGTRTTKNGNNAFNVRFC